MQSKDKLFSKPKLFSKAKLLEMNASQLGCNWIKNLENIKEYASIYPTGDASLNGRMYVALSVELTDELIKKYNILV
jgi:hypothetical protein